MLKGMYIAASGMNFQMNQLNEVASNLANVNTPGYKRNQLVSTAFGDLVTQFSTPTPFDRVGMGVQQVGRARWENQGPLQRTNNPLHVAISGQGYFQTQDPVSGVVQRTRNGDMRLDSQGFLATQEGHRVMGANNQPIQLAAIATETLRIASDGAIMSGPTQVGQIKVVGNPQNPDTFPISDLAEPGINTGFTTEQGYLEGSNVNVIGEMVNMITLNKAFTFGQKAISTQDNLLNKSVNDLGRVQ